MNNKKREKALVEFKKISANSIKRCEIVIDFLLEANEAGLNIKEADFFFKLREEKQIGVYLNSITRRRIFKAIDELNKNIGYSSKEQEYTKNIISAFYKIFNNKCIIINRLTNDLKGNE